MTVFFSALPLWMSARSAPCECVSIVFAKSGIRLNGPCPAWRQPTAAAAAEEGEAVRQTRAAEAAVVVEEEASRGEVEVAVEVAIDRVLGWVMLMAASALVGRNSAVSR